MSPVKIRCFLIQMDMFQSILSQWDALKSQLNCHIHAVLCWTRKPITQLLNNFRFCRVKVLNTDVTALKEKKGQGHDNTAIYFISLCIQ